MAFLKELLDMFRCRSAGSGLEQSAAINEWDDGEHLGTRSQLQDREEVCEIITKHIACSSNGVFSFFGAFQ